MQPETWRWRGSGRPWVMGHRGSPRALPENSLPSFAKARVEGADGVELDVRLSRDGVVMVAHDLGLGRVTGGRDHRLIAELESAELAEVNLGDGAGVPQLSQVLQWATRSGTRVNVELKAEQDPSLLVRAVAEVCRDHRGELVFSSFSPGALQLLAQQKVSGPRALLIAGEVAELPDFVQGVHAEQSLINQEQVARWHHRGLFVAAWTVNDPAAMLWLAEAGVDLLITDIPAVARALF